MKIKDLTLRKLSIPFRTAFKHASATRLETESVIAIAESESGKMGYGEGCPRSYVTGESQESCLQFFEKHKPDFPQLHGLNQLREWVAQNRSTIDSNPAAWCSIEMAILDLIARERNVSVEDLLSLPEICGSFKYTAVMGLNSLPSFKKQLQRYLEIGFTDFKIKISGKLEEDKERIELSTSFINDPSKIRLDANNVWDQPEDCIQYMESLEPSFFAIEEPISKNDFKGHKNIFAALKLPIILDESFCRLSQFDELQEVPVKFILNIRVSKMGGILRSLEIIQEAKRLNIPVIVGAQVGETSLLTRAALTLCSAFRDNIVAQEGAFGTHLLEYDITPSPLMFGTKGNLNASKAGQKPGLGIHVDSKTLNAFTFH
ncbi:MAG: hypothetical protein G3M70_13700 [Candidatus Nitronauta litoralis]|uniref:Mandelate racemase/muconate lactonizing enzyme C-terminal domain-containing protein n=1 Tax=Candidatus Nitronauta litoralis TaxID=2705533 RepID=A0A7T0BYK7_9BACT|nr:MAG: hypothetical protein G3M70_13700 [Candidatus Nitronauta litoralis]